MRSWFVFLIFFGLTSCVQVDNRVMQTDMNQTKDLSSPFGVLCFLDWDDPWNENMYPKKKLLKVLDAIEESGIKWIRCDFSWLRLEPFQNQFEYEKHDLIVQECEKRGLSLVGVLGYTPEWAQPENGDWNSPPANIDFFAQYVRRTVERYKGQVEHWEIWNEPNFSDYWVPQDDLKTYGVLLKKSYVAAKAANPKCQILLGGLTADVEKDLQQVYQLGLKDFFDIVNIHFIKDPFVPDIEWIFTGSIDVIHETMSQYGDQEKPIWITELGCPGVKKGAHTMNWDLGRNPTEEEQAEFLRKTLTTLLNQGKVQKVFWAFFQDTSNHFKNGIDTFGLLRNDFSKKPSYQSYTAVIRKDDK